MNLFLPSFSVKFVSIIILSSAKNAYLWQYSKSEIQTFYKQILVSVQSEVIFFWAISNIFISIKAPCVQNIS